MRGALEHHANATVAALSIPKSKLREVLLAMTTPEGRRSHADLASLVARFGEPARDAIVALEKARLVTKENGGVTFIHQSILEEWGLLRGWIEDAREDRLLLAHVERDAARWAVSKDPAELWRKGRLAAGIDLWKRGALPLSDDARAFLVKSSNEEGKLRIALWTLTAMVLMLVVGGSLVYAKESRERAEQAKQYADALAAALAEVKVLKQQAEENAGEAAASAALLNDLQKRMAEERASYGKNVEATLKRIAGAPSLETVQKATADLKAQAAPAQSQVVPLPMDLTSARSGPKLDTSGPSPSGGGGGTFDQAAIERVVNTRKAGVKRTCLERSASTASSTKVTATLTIAPSGAVQSVSSVGDDPVVGKCIEQQLRSWTFPAPGEVKQVQIPFVFVRQ
jgi:hypothetical protein